MGLITLHVLESIFFHIEECTTPKGICDKLMYIFSLVSEISAM